MCKFGKNILLLLSFLSLLVQPLLASSSQDIKTMSDQELLMDLKLQYQLLEVQYNYRVKLSMDLETKLKNTEELLQKEKNLSSQENLNYLNIKKSYDSLKKDYEESLKSLDELEKSLQKLKDEIGLLEKKVSNRKYWIGGGFLIGLGLGLFGDDLVDGIVEWLK